MVRRKVRRREFGRGPGVVVVADVDPARATWDRRMLWRVREREVAGDRTAAKPGWGAGQRWRGGEWWSAVVARWVAVKLVAGK